MGNLLLSSHYARPDTKSLIVPRLLADMRQEWLDLDRRIEAPDREFAELARDDVAARRLTSIPGIGTLNATALVAAVGDGATFAKARDLGAWLGLVRDNIQPGASRDCSTSPSAATSICASC
jgi:transposase